MKGIAVLQNPTVLKDRIVRLIIRIFRFLFILGLCYLFLFPLFYLIVAAIQDPVAAKDPTVVWIPNKVTFANFIDAFEQLDYLHSVTQTLLISVLGTAATLVSCSMVGYGFARFRFRESKLAFALVILIIIVPPQTTIMSNYVNFRFFDFFYLMRIFGLFGLPDHINLLGTPWTFILPSLFACGWRSGLFIFIFRQFFAGQPRELEEAAKIDGCSAFGTFRRIMVPLAVPAFITVMLFSFIWHWNENYSAAIYYSGNVVKPLAVQLNVVRDMFLQDTANVHYTATGIRGSLAAGSLLSILPSLVLYIFTQKYFTESVERTGIVG